MLGRSEVLALLLRGEVPRGPGPRRALAACVEALSPWVRGARRAARRTTARAAALLGSSSCLVAYAAVGGWLHLRERLRRRKKRRAGEDLEP